MRETHVAAAIIQLPDSYILHERKKGTDKGEIGKLGLYGGRIKKDEDYAQAASRELAEESGLTFPSDGFEWLGYVHVNSEREGKKILTEAEILSLLLPEGLSVNRFTSGIRMDSREISRARALGRLTSVADASFTKFMGI